MSPIKRTLLGNRPRNATNQINFRFNRTAEQREEKNNIERNRLSQTRSACTQEERENGNEYDMHRMRYCWSVETNRATINLNNLVRKQTNVALNTPIPLQRDNCVQYIIICCYWIDEHCVSIL